MQKAIMGLLAVLAIAGWAAAYVAYDRSQDLRDNLAASQDESAKLQTEFDGIKQELETQIAMSGSAQNIDQKLKAAEDRTSEIEALTHTKRQELIGLDKAVKARKLELNELERELIESTAALRSAQERTEAAQSELDRVHAEVAEQQAAAARVRNEAGAAPPVAALAGIPGSPEGEPGSSATALLPSKEAQTAATGAQSRPGSVFQVLDRNGDGEIDELEFRLNSIRLLGILDRNGDGAVTIDETKLPPEKFALFDRSGDGRMSSLEFVDAFPILDRDDKGSITREDYDSFIETAAN